MTSGIHERRLSALLAMDSMGASELKRTVNKTVPALFRDANGRELSFDMGDGKYTPVRELLVSEGVAASGLIPTEVYGTIVEGSEPAKCFRTVIPTFKMNSAVLKVPYGETGTYAPIVSEGAEIPMQDQTYGVATFTAEKRAVRPMITREMLSDQSFDVISAEVRKAGSRIENALNYWAMERFIDASAGNASTYDTDCGGSGATPLGFTGKAVGTMIGRGFTPTDIVTAPVFMGAILTSSSTLANQVGVDMTRGGQLGSLFGMRSHILGTTSTTAQAYETWAWAADGNKGALLLDRNAAGGIGMREDISVENFVDPIRDLVGMVVKARFDVQSFIPGAQQWVQF
jgi:hypothetical protein